MKWILFFLFAAFAGGACATDDFLMAGRWNDTTFDVAWESAPSSTYLIYNTGALNDTWQLHAYKFGASDTNLSAYSYAPYADSRAAFLRVYAGGDLLAVENFTRSAASDDVEEGHFINTYTSNPYVEYGDDSGTEVVVKSGDMHFDLSSAEADDVTVVTEGGRLSRMETGERLDFTVILQPADEDQPAGASWGYGLSYGTDEQWPASLIAVELEDNGAARFYWDGELAATGTIPDRDKRYVSIVFNTVSRRAAVVVNGVEYFFATNAVYDVSEPVQMVMHASKPAGDPALFKVDRYFTASLSASQQEIVAETSVFNPLYFGADPTGTMDSTPAFEQMFDRLGSSRHSEIFIPPGEYLLNSTLDVPASGNASQYGMQFRGGGEEVTRFLVNNTSGGIHFAGTSISWMQLTMRDLSIVALQPGIDYAFYMDVPAAGVTQNRMLNMINVTVRSAQPGDGNYFKTGYLVWNTWYPRFENIKVYADGTASNADWTCMTGLDIEDGYNPMIGDCVFSGVATGVVYAAPFKDPEDGKVIHSRFDECSIGLLIDIDDSGSWAEPAFHVNNCDFNFRDFGIYVNGMRQLFFSHNSFQCLDTLGSAFLGTGPARDFAPTDICLNYAYTAVVEHNFFSGASSTKRVAIDIQPASGYISILGNQFDLEGTAVENNSLNPVFVRDNVYGGPQGVSATLREYEAPIANESLLDGGFEADFSDSDGNRYEYRPSGTPWTFSGGAGYSEAATAFTGGNPSPPEGNQVLFLQNGGCQAAQGLILDEGTYTISFYAAQRLNTGQQTQQVQLLLGSLAGGTFQPTASGTYQRFEATIQVPSTGVYVLRLKGLGVSGSAVTAFVDDVRVVKQ